MQMISNAAAGVPGRVPRQRTHYSCSEVLSLMAGFKMLLLVFESLNLMMARVSDMLLWDVPLIPFGL